MRVGPFVFAVALAAATPALAQTVPDQQPSGQAPAAASQDPAQRFQTYVTSEGYKKAISQITTMGDTISAPECKEHKPQERAGLTIYAPPTFETAEHPVTGLWLDRIKMNRCGTTTFQNVLIQAQKEGQPPRMALMMPGSTLANPPMQNLIMKDLLAALAKNKCTDQTQIFPVDTKRDKETRPLKLDDKGMITDGAWKETWTLKACGKNVNATVDISSDGKGGLTHKVKL